MVDHLLEAFPLLRTTPYRVTSPRDSDYNCIAWAGGDSSHWWWPLDDPGKSYWPAGVPRVVTLESFRTVFILLGYAECSGETLEPGFEKVAIFTDADNRPTHAARQQSSGRWTSKLGLAEDIEHELLALEGEIYGKVVMVLRRPRSVE